ncbi:hypothetical protein D3C81_2185500 [compost metagenome]
MSLYVEALVREPCGEQERENHLGNEVDNPEQPSVNQRLPERGGIKEEIFEVLKRVIHNMDRLW